MYIKYGSLIHDDGKVLMVSFVSERILTQRGTTERLRKTATIRGYVTGSTQLELKAKIAAIEAGYGENNRDFGLYHDDHTVSAHWMPTATSLSGVKVVGGIRWEVETPAAEYATQRTFSVTLTADYLAGDTDQLIFFTESVTIIGTGGPRRIVLEPVAGPPIQQVVSLQTSVRAIQTGAMVGLTAYQVPSNPLWPQYELFDQRQIKNDSPRRDGTGFVEYPTSWTYVFHSTTPLFGFPTAR